MANIGASEVFDDRLWHVDQDGDAAGAAVTLDLAKLPAIHGVLRLGVGDLVGLLRLLGEPIRIPVRYDATVDDEPTTIEVRIDNANPGLLWIGTDGVPKAGVFADYLDGKFQFIAFGKEQLREDADGHVSIHFAGDGTFLDAQSADFPDHTPSTSKVPTAPPR